MKRHGHHETFASGDSRDTPQFQQDSLCQNQLTAINNSSLYLRTSNGSSTLQLNQKGTINQPGFMGSEYNSLAVPANQSDLYIQTTERKSSIKKSGLERRGVVQVLSNPTSNKKPQVNLNRNLNESLDSSQSPIAYNKENTSGQNKSLKNEDTSFKTTGKYLQSKCDLQQKEISKLKEQIEALEAKFKKVQKHSRRQLAHQQELLTEKDRVIASLEQQTQLAIRDADISRRELKLTQENLKEQNSTQAGVLQQIHQMKALVDSCRQSERDKESFLLKIKEKESQIREMSHELETFRQQSGTNQGEAENAKIIKKLQEDNHHLQAFQNKKIEEMGVKFEAIYKDYKRVLEENTKLLSDKESACELIANLEKSRDNYKDQSLNLKHELKLLKNKDRHLNLYHLARLEENDSKQGGSSSLNDTATGVLSGTNSSNGGDESRNPSKGKQHKEAVLGDIRSLIQEYKRERKLNQS